MSFREYGRPTKFYFPESISSLDDDFPVTIGDQDTSLPIINTTFKQILRFVEYIDGKFIAPETRPRKK